ncbi:thioredoxin family protein [Natronococcus wangiae]|uniref:thioredoxin family protein n=1 Tax=Natronococcus wangiae TaxID=3068275 RepID=UPI00273F6244|nr:thioredoxin family protein [Natronococcus sp. AD5]
MNDRAPKPTRLEDGADLDRFVERNDLALVEFYTKGCARCQAMEPVLGNVARATGVAVGLINPGNDVRLVDRFDVESVPTLVLFEDGSETGRIAEGFRGTGAVVTFVNEHAGEAVETE